MCSLCQFAFKGVTDNFLWLGDIIVLLVLGLIQLCLRTPSFDQSGSVRIRLSGFALVSLGICYITGESSDRGPLFVGGLWVPLGN